jgi:pimeloyl-ACP methyl ester carboxylesterase
MRTFRKVMVRLLAAGVLAFLVIPLLIPDSTSGSLTNVEAAGNQAEFVRINNLNVHVVTENYSSDCNCEAPLIVLMHGFGASTFSWREVTQPLSKLGEVIAYDRPAFGFTERPTSWSGVNPYGFEGNFELLDGLIAKHAAKRQVVLVGHSAGGQLAAEYARLNPTKVSALILVDPAILTTGGGPEGIEWFYQIPQIAKLGPILVSSIASSGDNLLRESFYDKSVLTQAIYDGYHQPLKVKGWEKAFWNFATAPRKNKLVENLANLKTPTLLITGDRDTVVPTKDTVRLDSLLPNSELEVIRQAGHLPHEEQPAEFLASVTKHWKFLLK